MKKLYALLFAATFGILMSANVHGQITSGFEAPVAGTHYWTTVTGICLGCGVNRPQNAADLNQTNYATLVRTVGAVASVTLSVKLPEEQTRESFAGFTIEQPTGINAVDFITVSTYQGSTFKQSASGAALLNVLAGGNRAQVGFVTNQPFNRVAITLGGAVGALASLQVYHGLSNPLQPLPVELVNFKVASEKGSALITWTTAQEKENKGFELQRSKDGITYLPVDFIEGQGNSSYTTDYKFEDNTTNLFGQVYYRLRQIDFDGKSTLSEVKAIKLASEFTEPQVYPNPFQSVLNVQASDLAVGNIEVKVFDLLGRQVLADYSNTSALALDTDKLIPGIYFLEVTQEGKISAVRIVKE